MRWLEASTTVQAAAALLAKLGLAPQPPPTPPPVSLRQLVSTSVRRSICVCMKWDFALRFESGSPFLELGDVVSWGQRGVKTPITMKPRGKLIRKEVSFIQY